MLDIVSSWFIIYTSNDKCLIDIDIDYIASGEITYLENLMCEYLLYHVRLVTDLCVQFIAALHVYLTYQSIAFIVYILLIQQANIAYGEAYSVLFTLHKNITTTFSQLNLFFCIYVAHKYVNAN